MPSRRTLSAVDDDGSGSPCSDEQIGWLRLRSSLENEHLHDEPEKDSAADLSHVDQHPADTASDAFEREKEFSILEQVEPSWRPSTAPSIASTSAPTAPARSAAGPSRRAAGRGPRRPLLHGPPGRRRGLTRRTQICSGTVRSSGSASRIRSPSRKRSRSTAIQRPSVLAMPGVRGAEVGLQGVDEPAVGHRQHVAARDGRRDLVHDPQGPGQQVLVRLPPRGPAVVRQVAGEALLDLGPGQPRVLAGVRSRRSGSSTTGPTPMSAEMMAAVSAARCRSDDHTAPTAPMAAPPPAPGAGRGR